VISYFKICVLWFFETKSAIKTQRHYRPQYGKDPPSGKATQRYTKQFQDTGNNLHRNGAGRPSTSQEDVDRIQEAFSRSPQKSSREALILSGIKRFELHFHIPYAALFCSFRFTIIDHGNPDNNLESSCTSDTFALITYTKNEKLNSVALARKRTIPTERPPLVGEVSANFC
jgi:hypothetical protein